MSLEEVKESFSNLSPKAIFLTLSIILPMIGGTAYVAITKYNQVTELVDNYQPYDDKEVRKLIQDTNDKFSVLDKKLEMLQTQINETNSRFVESSNHLVRLQEKASDASSTAAEARAVSQGSVRETTAALSSVREEIKSMREGLEAKMKALQRATTNPLGN
jgi:septation ring formation regulator EzrA